MRFFDVGVYRDDVLAVLKGLDGVIAPLQTLCDSPRESVQNDEALEMVLDARRCIADVLASPGATNEETDDFKEKPSSPASSSSL